MCCSTQGTAEPQETSEQAKTDWPGPAGLSALSRARPGLKQGCEHRQSREQGQGAGAVPGLHCQRWCSCLSPQGDKQACSNSVFAGRTTDLKLIC